MSREVALFKLDLAQSTRKAALEKIIGDGIQTFRAVGEALSEVKNGKLYADEFETFEEYLLEKWQIGRTRGYQLMEAAGAARNVSKYFDTPNETVAREIAKAGPKTQIKVAKVLAKVSTEKRVTAPVARAVVQQVKSTPRGGLAAMVAAARQPLCAVAQNGHPEIDLNLKPKMTPVAKAQASAMISEWFAANRNNLCSPPAATPEVVVRRILALFV